MKTHRETFGKAEKLCSNKTISYLFENGSIFHNSSFKVVWAISPVIIPGPAQVAFSVPKKTFRLAVTRNLIKRRMREAYRKNKSSLYDFLNAEHIKIAFVIIIKGTLIPDYSLVEKSMIDIIEKLIFQISETSKEC
jgi:ribonuclease P protein component